VFSTETLASVYRSQQDACVQSNWRLIGDGTGTHWPDVEKDISVRACSKANRQPSNQRL
jgi:hypothetical protein